MVMSSRPSSTPEVALPVTDLGSSPRVVWRTWVVVPDRTPQLGATVLLTGIFGFPWTGPTLQARCTVDNTDRRSLAGVPLAGGRHHPWVPSPSCTCGIYATDDLTEVPAAALLPPARPIATGFVRISGTIVRSGSVIRGQHASMMGPCTLLPGRMPFTTRLVERSGYRLGSPRVVPDGDHFRTSWARMHAGSSFVEWKRWAGAEVTRRYGIEVA